MAGCNRSASELHSRTQLWRAAKVCIWCGASLWFQTDALGCNALCARALCIKWKGIASDADSHDRANAVTPGGNVAPVPLYQATPADASDVRKPWRRESARGNATAPARNQRPHKAVRPSSVEEAAFSIVAGGFRPVPGAASARRGVRSAPHPPLRNEESHFARHGGVR